MLAWVALASLLVADSPAADPPAGAGTDAAIRREYDEVRGKAGRSAAEQVRLAYWCEAHGLANERLQHLSRAVLLDPANAEARGLLGLVGRDGRWLRPEAVAEREAGNPERAALLAEYDQRRAVAPYTAEGQFALGAWADDRGLKEQGRAHFTASVRLDPTRDAAWRRLGYRKVDGRWQAEAQVAAGRAEAEAQRAADKHWLPLLEKWRGMLDKPGRRVEAEALLAEVTDPRAVPSIARTFDGEANHVRAARLLGQIDSAGASRGLASLAVGSPSAEARRIATETLRGRDAREYADLLIALIRDRIKYEVVPVAGPGSPGVLQIEGPKTNLKRVYSPPVPQMLPGDRLVYDPNFGPVVERDVAAYSTGWVPAQQLMSYWNRGSDTPQAQVDGARSQLTNVLRAQGLGDRSPAIAKQIGDTIGTGTPFSPELVLGRMSAAMMPINPGTVFDMSYVDRARFSVAQMQQEAQQAASAAQKQLESDKETLDRLNADVDRTNDQVVATLRTATGLALPREREPWSRWWVDLVGYRFNQSSTDDKPTLVEQVPLGYQPQFQPIGYRSDLVGFSRMSCFGAGTPVQTINGRRAIETLSVGDLVLTQSTATGALHYQPILRTHHNPPGSTFRVRVGDEEIVSSDFHRFWVAGRGWVMARNLQPGDPIRTLGGTLSVASIAPGKVEPVFNLDVAEDADFFAGTAAALVHDNTLPDTRLVPFDRSTADATR